MEAEVGSLPPVSPEAPLQPPVPGLDEDCPGAVSAPVGFCFSAVGRARGSDTGWDQPQSCPQGWGGCSSCTPSTGLTIPSRRGLSFNLSPSPGRSPPPEPPPHLPVDSLFSRFSSWCFSQINRISLLQFSKQNSAILGSLFVCSFCGYLKWFPGRLGPFQHSARCLGGASAGTRALASPHTPTGTHHLPRPAQRQTETTDHVSSKTCPKTNPMPLFGELEEGRG